MPLAIAEKTSTQRASVNRTPRFSGIEWHDTIEAAIAEWRDTAEVVRLGLIPRSGAVYPLKKGLVCKVKKDGSLVFIMKDNEEVALTLGEHPLTMTWQVNNPADVGYVAGVGKQFALLQSDDDYILIARDGEFVVAVDVPVVADSTPVFASGKMVGNLPIFTYAAKFSRDDLATSEDYEKAGLTGNPTVAAFFTDIAGDYKPQNERIDSELYDAVSDAYGSRTVCSNLHTALSKLAVAIARDKAEQEVIANRRKAAK